MLLAGCGGGGGGGSNPPANVTISGTIFSEAGDAVDSDVNDSAAPSFVSNDTPATAQALFTPVILGGYVNLAGQGPEGPSFENGDASDFFAISLTDDAVVRIDLPDGGAAETPRVALFLLDRSDPSAALDAVNDISHTAALSVAAGDYFIEVRAISGAAAYKLIIGAARAAAIGATQLAAGDFVPGEVLVQLKSHQTTAGLDAMRSFAASTGMQMMDRGKSGWMRLQAADVARVFERLHLSAPRAVSAGRAVADDHPLQNPEETLRIVQALRHRPEVAFAEPNYIRKPFFTPNDPFFPLQWNLPLIHLPAAWDVTPGDANVIVAVIDSGIASNHPDLEQKLVPGYDFVSDNANSGDAQPGIDPDPEDPGDTSNNFHGTHVAGIVAAAFDNGRGVAGAGGHTRIMPVRVLGQQGGFDSDIINAIRWAAGLDITDANGNVLVPGASPRADIINMSFGGASHSAALALAIDQARAQGVILIAAAGNEGKDEIIYPADFANVISVGAVDPNGQRASYSNYNPALTLTAPGGNLMTDLQPDGYVDGVLSTLAFVEGSSIGFGYSYLEGTSMAAPHVAGVAALMKAVRPGLTPDEMDGYITGGLITSDLGVVGLDSFYGNGLIDAYLAVIAAAESNPPSVLEITPFALNLGTDGESAELYLRQVGSGPLALTSIINPAAWLSIERSAGQAAGDFGQYHITAGRSGLPGGLYTISLGFVSSVNTVKVPVTIQVLPDARASAGTQYISLLRADNLEKVDQITATPSNGVYSFTFENVTPGSYYLLSGSDLNNDYNISQYGEAVGGYPSIDQWAPIDVRTNVSGLQFVTGFSQRPYRFPVDVQSAQTKGSGGR